MHYLAGDIGGTKTHLALYREENGKLFSIKEEKFKSRDFPSLNEIVILFLSDEMEKPEKGCFGIAGPVKDGKCIATNLPWVVDEKELERAASIKSVKLINDLEANAYGLKMLKKEELYSLNKGDPKAKGNQAMVSAGTGLGEAGIYFDGKEHHPFACEGGHCDFAPRNEIEKELLKFLEKKFGHVSYERILSGPGLANLYHFLMQTGRFNENPLYNEINEKELPQKVTEHGLNKTSKACEETLVLFSSLYGAEAGNTALKMMALGGVYLGGGIAPKVLTQMDKTIFMKGFLAKGRFKPLLSQIPIYIVLNDKAALLGATYYVHNRMG